MKLIVGLGNPGFEYDKTRHNAGFMAVDRLTTRHARNAVPRARFQSVAVEANLPGADGPEKVLLLKPMTYMNLSGGPVAEALRFYKLDPTKDLFVIVDDIALPCGAIRVRAEGSPGGHNGLIDIERKIGTSAYPRCRVGIDAPGVVPQASYVTGKFSPEQVPLVNEALERAADAAEVFVARGVQASMNRFNTKAAAPTEAPERRPPATDN